MENLTLEQVVYDYLLNLERQVEDEKLRKSIENVLSFIYQKL